MEAFPCTICGQPGPVQCDQGGCTQPLCWPHASVESGPEDPYGFDGVDLRCPQHATPHRQTLPYGQAWHRRVPHKGPAYD